MSDIIQTAISLLSLIIFAPLLGRYMARAFLDENHVLKSIINPVEKTIYRLISCKGEEMDWKKYAYSLLVFNFMGFIFLLILQLSQRYLPLNPQKLSAPSLSLAFNTSVSLVTNTNWQ
jgi:K+-transporting ATPase ATPase A chain